MKANVKILVALAIGLLIGYRARSIPRVVELSLPGEVLIIEGRTVTALQLRNGIFVTSQVYPEK